MTALGNKLTSEKMPSGFTMWDGQMLELQARLTRPFQLLM